MTLVQTLAHAFAPWQSLFSDSKTVASVVTGVHLVGLLFGGGLAVAADRSTLRAYRRHPSERASALAELHAVHRPVLIALAVLFASGVALATADIETFLSSPVFYLKLVIVALLLANGAVLERTERALRRGAADAETRLWRRLKATTCLSLFLWTCTVLAGTVLVNAA
jgi:uncharacterized membrane-anchored protein